MLFALVIVLWRMQPPAAKGLDAPADEFSAGRAMSRLQQLLGEEVPHPVGSESNQRVAERIIAELVSFGYAVKRQETMACYEAELVATCGAVRNILTRLPGQEDGPAVMVVAHYDSVGAGAGVADDGAAVAAIIEVARLLKEEAPFKNPIIFLLTDGEEVGLLGADAFVSEHPWASEVGAVINLEARGNSGLSLMFETSENNAWLMEAYADAVPQPATNSLLFEIYQDLPNDTDLTVFKEDGMAGFNFAFIGNVAHYHTPLDTITNLNFDSLQHHGDNTLALARTLANRDLANPPAGNAVYMDLLGLTLIKWSESWTIPLAGVVLLLLLTITINFIRRKILSSHALLWGGLAWLLTLVVPIVLGLAITSLISALAGWQVPWYANPLPTRVALWTGVFFSSGLIANDLSRKSSFWGLTLGTWLAWAILSMLLALSPFSGATILFLVPTVVASLMLGIAEQLQPPPEGNKPSSRLSTILTHSAIIVPALVAALVWMPIIFLLESALGLESSPIITLPLALLAGTLAPLFMQASKNTRIGFLASCTTLMIIGTIFAVLSPPYNENSPQQLTITHIEERHIKQSNWGIESTDRIPDSMSQLHAFSDDATFVLPWSSEPLFAAEATPNDAPSPQLDILSDTFTNGERIIKARLTSPRGGNQIKLLIPTSAALNAISVANKKVTFDPLTAEDDFYVWECYGESCNGIEIDLHIANRKAIEMLIADQTPGLPPHGDALLQARPANATPAHNGDASVIVEQVEVSGK